MAAVASATWFLLPRGEAVCDGLATDTDRGDVQSFHQVGIRNSRPALGDRMALLCC